MALIRRGKHGCTKNDAPNTIFGAGDLAHKVGVVVKEGQRVGDGKERGKWGKAE